MPLQACAFGQLGECLQAALALDGAVRITNVPDLARTRTSALSALAGCALDSEAPESYAAGWSGWSRRTLLTRTLRGSAVPLDGRCAQHARDADASLRTHLDLMMGHALRTLEPLVRAPREGIVLPGGEWYSSLADVGHGVEHLQYTHLLTPHARGEAAEAVANARVSSPVLSPELSPGLSPELSPEPSSLFMMTSSPEADVPRAPSAAVSPPRSGATWWGAN